MNNTSGMVEDAVILKKLEWYMVAIPQYHMEWRVPWIKELMYLIGTLK